MKFFNKLFLSALVLSAMVLTSCDKTQLYDTTIPPALSHFTGGKTQLYRMTSDADKWTINVGTTDVSNSDRTLKINITSPSGAAEGTDYSISGLSASKTIVIPAGKALASFLVDGVFANYPDGQYDTLLITISDASDVQPAQFQNSVQLIIYACDDGVVTPAKLASMVGDYTNTNELLGTSAYGPYTTTVESITVTGPTTAVAAISNIWDTGWGNIEFTLDWSDPANPTATVIDNQAVPNADAGDLSSTYAGSPVAVQNPGSLSPTPGSFSVCDFTFNLKMQLGVGGLGFFNSLYTVDLAR